MSKEIDRICSIHNKIERVIIHIFICINALLEDGLLFLMYVVYTSVPQNKEKSISLKTMEDGQVLLYSVSSGLWRQPYILVSL